MTFEIGIACSECDTFSPMGTPKCPECGHNLSLESYGEPESQPRAVAVGETKTEDSSQAPQPKVGPADTTKLSEEELMEQARNYICRDCSVAVPSGHKFCGTCGAAVPPEIVEMQTNYFGTLQTPGRARLILIRGDSDVDGLSYLLQGTEHVAGREQGQILFPEDPWMSPRHANFVYEGDALLVRDENSVNGVFLRVREPVQLEIGDQFLCGEQLLMLAASPEPDAGPGTDQTYFYATPHRAAPFLIVQVLRGGASGSVFAARGNAMEIGREECDVSYPADLFISGKHARVEMGNDGRFTLTDLGSKNGTYVRIRRPQALRHGDYLFLGRQLLRVEMTT